MTPGIDADRLWSTLMSLAEIGAYTDPGTGLRGVCRLALTEADGAGRRQVKTWMEAAGLEVRVDRIGNVIGRRRGRDDALAPVMSGSHIDSVSTGGAFDGALGVIGALEAVRSLNDAGLTTRRPIEIAFFTDEEGARFATDMLGSAVAVGRIALEDALGLRDRDGVSVGDALETIGFAGPVSPRLPPPHAYLEVHVEQGPVLAREGWTLGVVTGVQGISWQRVEILGRSAHAGTTPMELRRDAGLAAARVIVRLRELVDSGRFGALRANVGRIDLHPNLVNIVPSRALISVDLRNPDDAAMAAAEAELDAFLVQLAAELEVEIRTERTARTPHVPFAPEIQDLLSRCMQSRGLRHRRILSGAGHDAQELASLCPTAMIFVPGEHDGISHNPREWSSPEACAHGVQILLDGLIALADA
jgi:N-carbamoyl-L-amino-acid hydrolase